MHVDRIGFFGIVDVCLIFVLLNFWLISWLKRVHQGSECSFPCFHGKSVIEIDYESEKESFFPGINS